MNSSITDLEQSTMLVEEQDSFFTSETAVAAISNPSSAADTRIVAGAANAPPPARAPRPAPAAAETPYTAVDAAADAAGDAAGGAGIAALPMLLVKENHLSPPSLTPLTSNLSRLCSLPCISCP